MQGVSLAIFNSRGAHLIHRQHYPTHAVKPTLCPVHGATLFEAIFVALQLQLRGLPISGGVDIIQHLLRPLPLPWLELIIITSSSSIGPFMRPSSLLHSPTWFKNTLIILGAERNGSKAVARLIIYFSDVVIEIMNLYIFKINWHHK